MPLQSLTQTLHKINMKEKTGSKYAILIGLPIGLMFSALILIASLFPPFNFVLFMTNLQGFWHPLVWAGIIPISYIYLLWHEGRKISSYLQTKNILTTSFIFTLKLNLKLFAIILLIGLLSVLFFGISTVSQSQLISLFVTTIAIILTFIFATLITTFSISLLIVQLTQNKLKDYV